MVPGILNRTRHINLNIFIEIVRLQTAVGRILTFLDDVIEMEVLNTFCNLNKISLNKFFVWWLLRHTFASYYAEFSVYAK